MILHVPHASREIPERYRQQIVLPDNALHAELTRMTDAYTDELFVSPESHAIIFPLSRLLVDVERYADDDAEPMSAVGMGVIYTRTAHGEPLKRILQPQEIAHMRSRYYDTHHKALADAVQAELAASQRALIVDCHSFPSRPLPCDRDQSGARPDICIGTDAFHTSLLESERLQKFFRNRGYTVDIDRPYAGTIVPIDVLGKDSRVASIMIEINRALYMNEVTGAKAGGYERVKQDIQDALHVLGNRSKDTPRRNDGTKW